MREILFRGKLTNGKRKGQWAYGNLLQVTFGDRKYYRINGTNNNCNVDPDTIGQYTGNVDRYRNKIFEGDIVNMRLPQAPVWIMCKVVYNEDRASFLFESRGGCSYAMHSSIRSYYEVKGNKWDSSELLEKTE